MTVKGFIRMRRADRDLEMLPQAMLFEVLDCYLDANDIAPFLDEAFDRKIPRLMAQIKRRRASQSS